MAQTYQVGDTQYQFPDNYTDDQVTGILSKQGIIGVPAVAAQTPPDASAEGAQAPADQGLYVNPNTPKPRGMVQPGNIDLRKLPVTYNDDGSYSTLYSTSFTDEKPGSPTQGKDVLVRGILNGKKLDDLESKDEAKRNAAADAVKQEYYKTGQHLGIFQPGADAEYKSQTDPATLYGINIHKDWEAGRIPGVQMPAPAKLRSPQTPAPAPQLAVAGKNLRARQGVQAPPQKPSDTLPDPAAAVQIATALGRHIAEIATRPPSEMPPSIAPSSSPWSPPVKPAPTPGRQFASSSYQIEGPEPPPRGPVFVHRAGPLPAAYTTEPTTRQILQTPIIKPEDIDEAFPFLVGPFRLHAGMLKAAAGMTSPENAAIAAGSAGLGMIPGMTAKIASTGLSVYFATQAGKALLDKYPQLKSAVKAKDWQSALELGGGAVADAAMFYGAGKHALLTARGIPADLAARARAKAAKASAPEPTANTTGTEPYRPRPEPKPTEETTHENRKEPAPREPAAEPEGGRPAQSEPAVSARRGGEHERSTSVEPRARAEPAAAPKEVTSGGPDIKLNEFNANRGGYASAARLVLTSPKKLTAKDIQDNFFKGHHISVAEIRPSVFTSQGDPNTQLFSVQFHAPDGAAISAPEGIEESLGLKPGERYFDKPATGIPRQKPAAAPKEVNPEDRLPPVAPGFVRLYRGQSTEFSPASDYSVMTPQERARLPLSETAEDRPGLQFTTDPNLARVHSGGKPLLYVDVPEDVANAESTKQPEKWHDETGRLLPAEHANRARRVPAAAETAGWLQRLDASGREADQWLREHGYSSGERLGANAFTDPEFIRRMSISVAGSIARGALDFKQFSRNLVETYGPRIKPVLRQIWDAAGSVGEEERRGASWHPGMPLEEIEAKKIRVPKIGKKLKVDDVARYLDVQTKHALGSIPATASDKAKSARLMASGSTEMADQMKKAESGADWYSKDTKLADAHMAAAFPELRDPVLRGFQKAISAVMSNNSTPSTEAYHAARIYEKYRKTGRLPMKQPNRRHWPAQGAKLQLTKIQKMLDVMGVPGFVDFIAEPHTLREVRKWRPSAKGRMDDEVPGSMVLGPKIGRYWLDLMGRYHSGSTVDKWDARAQYRRLGRLMNAGKVRESPSPESERPLFMQLHADLAKAAGLERASAAQSVLWHYEQDLYRRLGLTVRSTSRSQGTARYIGEKGVEHVAEQSVGSGNDEPPGGERVGQSPEQGREADVRRSRTPGGETAGRETGRTGRLARIAEAGRESERILRRKGLTRGESLSSNRIFDPEVAFHLTRAIAGDVARGVISLRDAAMHAQQQLLQWFDRVPVSIAELESQIRQHLGREGTAAAKSAAGEPERERDTGPTYMGTGLGAFEPLFRESKAEGDRLRNARNDALAAARAAEAKPQEMKAGEKIREYFTAERDLWAARTNQVMDRISRILLPKIQDREALGIAREFRHHPTELEAFLDGTHPFLDEVDGGAKVWEKNLRPIIPLLRQAQRILSKPTARESAADAMFTRIAERDLKEGRAGGWLESRWLSDEYLPHALNPKGEGAVARVASTEGRPMGKIGKYFGFGERRSERYPTMVHAVADGIIPKTLDPSALFTIHADQFARARATHMLEAHLADSGLGKWGDNKSAPEGWVQLAPHTDEFKKSMAYAVPGSFDPESRESELGVGTLGLYVPPYIAKALRPITAPDYLNELPGFAKVRTLQRGLKEAILGMSGFHLLTENFMAAADIGPSGMYRAFKEPLESPATLANERDLIASGGTTSIQGTTMGAYRSLRPGTVPTRAEVVRAYIPGSKQALWVADAITRFTFENVQRRYKIWSFALHRDAWINDNPNATPEQLAQAKKGIASYVNGVFGGLHWENMGWSRAMVEVARLALLAPDWSGSNVALGKYAADAPLSPREIPFAGRKFAGATTKESAQARLARAFWTKQLTYGLVATQMLSLMLSQKLSHRPMQVYMGTDKDGNEVYQNVFFRGSIGDATNLGSHVEERMKESYGKSGAPGLLSGLLTGTGVFVQGKTAPITKFGMHTLTGRDDRGRPITPGGLAGDVLPVPIIATSFWKQFFGDEADKYLWSERILSMFGPMAQHVGAGDSEADERRERRRRAAGER